MFSNSCSCSSKNPRCNEVHVLCRVFGGSLQEGNGAWGKEGEMKGEREEGGGIRALLQAM